MFPDEFWIIVCQYDCNPNGVFIGNSHPKGPLVMEQYITTKEEAVDKAHKFKHYGQVRVLRVSMKDQPKNRWEE